MIDLLAKRAQQEKVPEFDVAEAVHKRITLEQQERLGLLPFDLFAAASAAAAVVVTALSIRSWYVVTDPLAQAMLEVQEVRLW
jgi:hypothetical protein